MNAALKMRRRVKARELKDVDAHWVSMVERPASGLPFRMTKSWLPKELPKPFKNTEQAKKSQKCNQLQPKKKADNTERVSITPNQVVDAFDRLTEDQQIEALEKILDRHRKSVERKNFARQEMGLRTEKPLFRRNG